MQVMPEAAFVRYLTSESNSPIVPEPQNYTLDRPMNEYITSSSHNTYLLGRQVAEVDCWDGNSGQPEVNHGRTLITSISFRKVMTTIYKYAFAKSRFPLWISLEVHCSPNQQAIMVNIMKEAFGSRLVTEILEDSYDNLPSPSDLRLSENYDEGPAVATYTAKLSNLKQGYHTLPLFNDAGDQYLFSKLFCKVKFDSIEKIIIAAPRRALDGSRIKGIGGKAFNRINNRPEAR
ncbi:hypothetical protein ACJZ2D_013375 [Fusarium nematophilum]